VSSDHKLVELIFSGWTDSEKAKAITMQDANDNGRTLLHKVARAERGDFGGVEIVKFLINCPGFNPNIQSFAGSPLHSTRTGKLVRLLVQHGADLSVVTKKQRNSLLSTACSSGYMDTIRTLVELGVDINQQSINGNTPLIWAVLNKEIEPVKYLLEKGARVDLVASNGLGPLHWGTKTFDALTTLSCCNSKLRHMKRWLICS